MKKDDQSSQLGRPPDPESHRSRMERGEARQLTVIVSEDVYRSLKIQAAKTDRTMSEMVEEAVEKWLLEHDS